MRGRICKISFNSSKIMKGQRDTRNSKGSLRRKKLRKQMIEGLDGV